MLRDAVSAHYRTRGRVVRALRRKCGRIVRNEAAEAVLDSTDQGPNDSLFSCAIRAVSLKIGRVPFVRTNKQFGLEYLVA